MRNPSRSQAAALERTSASNVSFGLPAVAESSNSNNNDSLLAELEIEFAEKVGQMRELSDRLALRVAPIAASTRRRPAVTQPLLSR